MIIYKAQGFSARFLGWHVFPFTAQVLYFPQCKAVHGFGLKRPLAILFVDKTGKTVGSWQCLRPNRVLFSWQAEGVLEMDWGLRSKRHRAWVAFQQGQNTFKPWRYSYFGQTHCDK